MTEVVIAITGASGAAIGLRIFERLQIRDGIEPQLIISPSARRTIAHEIGPDALESLLAAAGAIHDHNDIGASLASGSYPTAGMIVAPCSMRTLAAIATGLADNLIVRAADVHL
ncbi:MAG TPA: UbiX family flavin prenyltransferase, partial [Devosia sp.]|nr:UbiX family flavin prenyltransferase [Devosia sp.]